MTSSTTTTTPEPDRLTRSQVQQSLRLIEVSPGKHVSEAALRAMLPDVETALFFGKVYNLSAAKLGEILGLLFHTSVIQALVGEGDAHSTSLQGYAGTLAEELDEVEQLEGVGYDDAAPAPDTELLAQLFEAAITEVADSISKVADKIHSVLDRLPSKYGEMTFATLRKMNVQRGTLGRFNPVITHPLIGKRLVVLDVSGSMTESTVRTIASEVVGLAYKANASLAIVSDHATYWEAGTFTVDDVLKAATYGGTQYGQLLPLFHQDWEAVIAIADYDSWGSASDAFRSMARGRIGQLFDISLVNRPTYLGECLGQIASEVKPLLIGNSGYVLQ